MKCDIRNHSSMSGIEKVAESLYKYAQKQLGFEQPARVVFESHGDRAVDLFSPTANYNPQTRTIKIFVDHRHPKDILRSMAHELIHHAQCCQGAFDVPVDTSPGYAQKDSRMRDLERDAYFWGNGILFRDWEDNHKSKRSWNLMNENKKMSLNEIKLRQKVRRMIMQALQENDDLIGRAAGVVKDVGQAAVEPAVDVFMPEEPGIADDIKRIAARHYGRQAVEQGVSAGEQGVRGALEGDIPVVLDAAGNVVDVGQGLRDVLGLEEQTMPPVTATTKPSPTVKAPPTPPPKAPEITPPTSPNPPPTTAKMPTQPPTGTKTPMEEAGYKYKRDVELEEQEDDKKVPIPDDPFLSRDQLARMQAAVGPEGPIAAAKQAGLSGLGTPEGEELEEGAAPGAEDKPETARTQTIHDPYMKAVATPGTETYRDLQRTQPGAERKADQNLFSRMGRYAPPRSAPPAGPIDPDKGEELEEGTWGSDEKDEAEADTARRRRKKKAEEIGLEEEKPLKEWYNNILHEALLKKFKIKK